MWKDVKLFGIPPQLCLVVNKTLSVQLLCCAELREVNDSCSFSLGTLLPSPVACLLTDPGSLCPGDMTTLTCHVTGGLSQQWVYNNQSVGLIIPTTGQVPAPQRVDGVEFRLSLLSADDTVSQITFVANEGMDGIVVECRTTFSRNNSLTDTTTLQVASGSECTRAWARSRASNSRFCCDLSFRYQIMVLIGVSLSNPHT
jgi:hypothetical protein